MSTTVQHQPWCTTHSEKDPNSLKTEEWCSRDTRIGGEDGPLVAVNNAEGVLEIELWQANGDCRLAPAEAREVRLRADVRSRPRADGSREASRRAIGASVTACMVDRGITPQRLAQDIGMTEGNLWRRLAGASGFTAEDISRIARDWHAADLDDRRPAPARPSWVRAGRAHLDCLNRCKPSPRPK